MSSAFTNRSYAEVLAEWRESNPYPSSALQCVHPEGKQRFTRLVDSAGREHMRLQCRECGKLVKPLKRDDVPADAIVLPWDGGIANRRWQRMESAYRDASAIHRQKEQSLWHDYYTAYLESARWLSLRARVFARRGVCECCGVAPASDCHHLTYARLGAEKLSDMAALCDRCHKSQHKHLWAYPPQEEV